MRPSGGTFRWLAAECRCLATGSGVRILVDAAVSDAATALYASVSAVLERCCRIEDWDCMGWCYGLVDDNLDVKLRWKALVDGRRGGEKRHNPLWRPKMKTCTRHSFCQLNMILLRQQMGPAERFGMVNDDYRGPPRNRSSACRTKMASTSSSRTERIVQDYPRVCQSPGRGTTPGNKFSAILGTTQYLQYSRGHMVHHAPPPAPCIG